MGILVAFVVLVGALCLTDLVLTIGVIRRLREHTGLLSRSPGSELPVIGLAAGQSPAPFEAVTTDGQHLTGPAGFHLAAFFALSCSSCPERVPAFVAYVRSHRVEPARVLAVVLGQAGEPVPYLAELAAVAQVCREPLDGPLAKAFAVSGYPAFCLLDADGAVTAVDFDPASLPVPAAA